MSKNVLLVYPQPGLQKNPRFGFSMQLLQLSSILKKFGTNNFYLDFSYGKYEKSDFGNFVKNNKIDIIIVEVDTFALKRSENTENAIEILKISKELGVKTIAFGYDCIMDGNSICFADYVVKENPLIQIPQILGFTYDISNYDDLPFPDRDLLLTNEYFKKNEFSTLIRTAEGCLNTCTFCQRRGWQSGYKYHSIEYVLNEFSLLKSKGYKNIWIVDENFTFNINRAKELLKKIIQNDLTAGMKVAISSWTRIDFDFLDLAKQANISIISMGIESANPEILSFYKKDIDLAKTRELIEYADSIGIFTVGNFIIGAPIETKITIHNTFNYIISSKLDQINIKVLDYMIGSVLYESLEKKEKHHYFGCKENGLCNFSLNELTKLKNDFLKKFYDSKKDYLKNKINTFGSPYNPMVK